MVKKLVSVFCICAYFGLAHAQIPQEIWKESEQIEKQIKKTSFPDRVYNIKDFGAKEGNNGEIFCHEAINLAILTCSQAGGGTVLVPPGEFLTGPITLKSNVNLHLEEGAYLKFSSEKYLKQENIQYDLEAMLTEGKIKAAVPVKKDRAMG